MAIWAVDTSVLIAGLVTGHPRFAACDALLRHVERERIGLVTGAHALTEAFTVLCRLPLRPMITPSVAAVLVRDGIERRCRVASIDMELQRTAIAAVVDAGRGPSAVVNALHVACARRARADRLWTLDRRDVLPFWDEAHVFEPESLAI
jgi:predicted nucleic acid-binding protein